MRLSIFAPYGPFSQESGLMYLIGSYASKNFKDIYQLKCNGVFSTCDRDAETNWRRDFSACFQCSADQQHLEKWSGIKSIELSSCITPESIDYTKKFLFDINASQLEHVKFEDIHLFELCRDSFSKRVGNASYDSNNKRHEQILRNLFQTSIRTYLATKEYIRKHAPNYILLAGGVDFISQVTKICSLRYGVEPIVFRWDIHKRIISIVRASSGKEMQSELLLDGVANMRPDHNTWPNELLVIVNNVMEFLNLNQTQLTLPITPVSTRLAS